MSTNLIPENIYKFRATTNWSLSETSKGTPYTRVEFEITDGPMKGRKLSKDFYLSDKTWERTVESLRCCGWQGDDVSNLAGVETREVVGKVVHEMITDKEGAPKTDEQGNAQYRAQIAWVGEDRAPKPMEATKLSSFRELMKARLQSMGAPVKTATPPDDDLPDFLRQ
jgi:hypothetical protein